MNEHTRYLWLILPQIIIVACLALDETDRKWKAGALLLCGWLISTGIWSFPCGISYFNEMAGGDGSQLLAGSNIDWRHGWITARDWLERNEPEYPVVVITSNDLSLSVHGIYTTTLVPSDMDDPDPIVTLLIGVDERLKLQRDRDFSGHALKDVAGCCVEVYEMRLHELANCNWKWVVGKEEKLQQSQ